MAIKSYSYNDTTQLTNHFKVSEFKCKCGKNHDIKIDEALPTLLEKLMEKIGAEHGNIYSGYRCPSHNKAVGSSSTSSNYSHSGYAVDIYFKDKSGKAISGKTVALALEDMGHKYGIGVRCGGASLESGKIHIDVKPRKWYGDESKSMSKDCCSSFYDYFGVKKEETSTNTQETTNVSKNYVKLTSAVWCRKGIGFSYAKYKCIPKGTQCELLKKNAGTSNGYKWDYIVYNDVKCYLPNKWNQYL